MFFCDHFVAARNGRTRETPKRRLPQRSNQCLADLNGVIGVSGSDHKNNENHYSRQPKDHVQGLVPLGYDADGRTLKIDEQEAKTIRMLYGLYEERGTVRAVKQEADVLGLRTRQRETTTGKTTGGGLFDRGHIYHLLTNPI